jgi:hypothetical protein
MKVATDLPPDELAALDDWRRPATAGRHGEPIAGAVGGLNPQP